MIEEALHGVAVYNPDLLSRDELKRYFVGRLPLLERILADLRREPAGRIPQHRLFLGQRGMGKTSLLRRLAVAVDEDQELAAVWLPLTFPEEQYNIARPADLWLNCLDALGDAMDRAGRRAEAQALDERIERLAGAAPEIILAALLEEAARLGRRLLLLLDNADLILDRLRDSHWALRETLQTRPELLVFGASARAIEASYKYDAAFYDFFRIDELKGLTEDELRATLIRLAEVGNTPAVAELVRTDPARIRTLHVLTGGNPRTTVLLYGVLAQGGGGDVRSDLEGLLDRVTPLYKARFEELPELSQKLVDALALHWDPASARQLADRLGWEVNLVSAQLARLQTQGLVEKTEPYRGKRALFQIGERFFNIWYLMRASRRVRRRLTWLVRFLRMWFNAAELQGHVRGQLARLRSTARNAEYSLALAQCIDSPPLRSALETHGLRALMDDRESRKRIGELFDLSGEDACLKTKAERMQALAEIRERVGTALAAVGVELDRERLLFRLLGDPYLNLPDKQRIAEQAGTKDSARWKALDRRLESRWSWVQRAFGCDPNNLYQALADGDMEGRDDIEGAEAASERLGNSNLIAMAWWFRDTKDAEEAERAVTALQASSLRTGFVLYEIGRLLETFLERYDKAEDAYRSAIELDPQDADPWKNLGHLLEHHFARYEEAEDAYRHAIEIDSDDDYTYNNLAWLLYQRGGDLNEARSLAERAGKLAQEDLYAVHTLATILVRLADWPAAAPLITRLIEEGAEPFLEEIWEDILLLFRETVSAGRAADALHLLDSGEAGERWRPLREAVAAAVEGTPDYLREVAPEVRRPAEQIYARLTAPTPSASASSVSSPPPPNLSGDKLPPAC